MPDWGKEERPDPDKKASTAAMKSWLIGLTKKKKEGAPEESPVYGSEPVLVSVDHA